MCTPPKNSIHNPDIPRDSSDVFGPLGTLGKRQRGLIGFEDRGVRSGFVETIHLGKRILDNPASQSILSAAIKIAYYATVVGGSLQERLLQQQLLRDSRQFHLWQ